MIDPIEPSFSSTAEDNGSASLYSYCLQLLARREYSQAELLKKMSVKFPDLGSVARASVLKRLVSAGYQSDERFANAMVRYGIDRGYGIRRIQQTLKQKGVPSDIAGEALMLLTDDEAIERGKRWVASRFGRGEDGQPDLSFLKNFKEKQKCTRQLAYRGYSFAQIQRILAPE